MRATRFRSLYCQHYEWLVRSVAGINGQDLAADAVHSMFVSVIDNASYIDIRGTDETVKSWLFKQARKEALALKSKNLKGM